MSELLVQLSQSLNSLSSAGSLFSVSFTFQACGSIHILPRSLLLRVKVAGVASFLVCDVWRVPPESLNSVSLFSLCILSSQFKLTIFLKLEFSQKWGSCVSFLWVHSTAQSHL